MSTATLTKTNIVSKILADKNFKSILKTYQTGSTEAFSVEFKNEYKNGLGDVMFGITLDGKIVSILMPIFSTEKTITWNFSYLKTLRAEIPSEYEPTAISDEELIDMAKCPLYFYDSTSDEPIFMTLVSLRDWLDNGSKGRNGFSVYFWNDKLPNQWSKTKKDLSGEVFVTMLPSYSNKQLKTICLDYANKHHAKFADVSQRSEQTKVKNIANGLYAQIKVYLWMKDQGYNVSMKWNDGDDLGIDIVFNTNGTQINIDVKSTKTEELRISKNRKETDFYAVCIWNKSEPELLGFLFKYHFWKSDVINTDMPEKKGDMYSRKLTKKYVKNFVKVDGMFDIVHNYRTLNMKRGARLFNQE